MKWTSEKPTQPGFYICMDCDSTEQWAVELVRYAESLQIGEGGAWAGYDFEWLHSCKVGLWAGPLMPTEARVSSVDRQREQVTAGNAESATPSAGVQLEVWRERVDGWKPRMCIWVPVGELRALLDELEACRGD